MAKFQKFCVYSLIITFTILATFYISTENNQTPRNVEDTRINILYWTPMFSRPDFYLGLGSEIFKSCKYNNCYTTHDRNRLPIEKFDAIIFHAQEFQDIIHGLPNKRNQEQMYIASIQESPLNTPWYPSKYKNFYNWTMTYRLDSDILRPYGRIIRKNTRYQPPTVEEIQKKPKRIAWFVSNCATSSQRENIVNKIARLYPVDVYGLCGNFSCPKDYPHCYDLVEKNYKYYLAFENSVCVDYVTEKLYNILQKNIVPIVYGGADYEKIAPPGSVINIETFSSVEELVKFIRFLDENPQEYLKYFLWKRDYFVDTTNQQTLCNLCEKLNEKKVTSIYKDFDRWWRKEMCSKEIYKQFI